MAAEQRRVKHPFNRIDGELDLPLALGKHVVTELDLDQLLQRVAEYAQLSTLELGLRVPHLLRSRE